MEKIYINLKRRDKEKIMKNTVVLKNINSNLIEEAIIVFRENVKIKEKQLVKGSEEKNKISETEKLAIDEAENVILDYIKDCEIEEKRNKQKLQMRILKVMNIVLVILLVTSIIF